VQFGEPIGGVIDEPGLHWRIPFVQEVRRFDKRLLAWDGDVSQIPTLGREFIIVDTTARWRIADPLQFLRSVRDESGARTRLDDIIDSVARDIVSGTDSRRSCARPTGRWTSRGSPRRKASRSTRRTSRSRRRAARCSSARCCRPRRA
jgi:hypothetical protein